MNKRLFFDIIRPKGILYFQYIYPNEKLVFIILLLFADSAFGKSCLFDLPSGHHAIVAIYDESNHCIIKSCMPTYRLFQNKCYKNDEYEHLTQKEKICVESGGYS